MVNLALLVLRLVFGLTVAAHGAQKLFGWFGGPGITGFSSWLQSLGIKPAKQWAVVASLAEFAGGLLVALGLVTPIAALAVCGSMLVAILVVHAGKGFFVQNGGYEFPLAILAAMVAISIAGPGVFSLDQLLRVSLVEPITWYVAAVLALVGTAASLVSTKLPERATERRVRPA